MARSILYAYRVILSINLEARLNEAWERGWKVHTFTYSDRVDINGGSIYGVLFERYMSGASPPFADDEDDNGTVG